MPAQPLRDIPQLQQKLTLTAIDQPVADVLKRLSLSLKADLSAENDVADQRITLHLVNQPVSALMDRLARLLSHYPSQIHGYYWMPLTRPAGARPAFQLWRDMRSLAEEQSARDYPKREIVVMLRDMRSMARLPLEERAAYQGDYPNPRACNPSSDALALAIASLDDSQIDALVAGSDIPFPPAAVPSLVSAAAEGKRQLRLFLTKAAQPGWPPASPSVEVPPPGANYGEPVLSVTPFGDPDNGDPEFYVQQSSQWQYEVSLGGTPAFINDSMLVNTYDTQAREKAAMPPPSTLQGPIIDLTPLLTAKGVTRAQRRDIGFTLAALAQAAHLSLYQEAFLRTNTVGERSGDGIPVSDLSSVGLTTLKGTLPVLLAAIGAQWSYDWEKVGNDYLFWSRTWAEDRASDVPERLIATWRQRLKAQGALGINDRAEIAAALSLRQIVRTLNVALPEAGPWSVSAYPMYRFIGQLSQEEKAAALSNSGLALGSLPPWEQAAFIADFRSRLRNISEGQLQDAVVRISLHYRPQNYRHAMQFIVTTGTATLVEVISGTGLAAPAAASRTALSPAH